MWLLSLWTNPIARKVILYGAAGLAILFAIRLWSNRVWDEGFRQGKTAGAVGMERQKKSEWEAKASAIAVDAAKVAEDRIAVEAQASALARSRRDIQETLSRSLNQIALTSKVNSATAIAVPDADLDSALRALSARLAAAVPR